MSESEVQHVDRFLKSELNNLVGYLDVHSYSQLWLNSLGFQEGKSKRLRRSRKGDVGVRACRDHCIQCIVS